MIVSQDRLQKALDAALSTGADFAEVFLEDSYGSTRSMVELCPKLKHLKDLADEVCSF